MKALALMIVVVISIIWMTVGALEGTIYIIPDSNFTTSLSPSFTLQELYEKQLQSNLSISSGTIFEFVSGNHVIQPNIFGHFVIRDVANITLCGLPGSATVTCLKLFGIAFVNVTNLAIINLKIKHCGVEISSKLASETLSDSAGVKAALVIFNIQNFKLDSVTINASFGYGMLAVNILGNSIIFHSIFSSNNFNSSNMYHCWSNLRSNQNKECEGGNFLLFYEDPKVSGCINTTNSYSLIVRSSKFVNGVSVVYSNFNSGSGAGFAVIMKQVTYSVNLTLLDSLFFGNFATEFGANVFVKVGSTVTMSHLSLDGCFIAKGNVFLPESPDTQSVEKSQTPAFSFFHGVLFFSNQYTTDCSPSGPRNESISNRKEILSISNCIFFDNVGGAISLYFNSDFAQENKLTIRAVRITNTNFTNNKGFANNWMHSVDYSSPSISKPVELVIENCQILKNNYPDDLDIFASFFSFAKSESSLIEFQLSKLFTNGKFVNMKNVTIRNCTFVENELTPVHALNSCIYFEGKNTFSNNTALFGGALYLSSESTGFIKPNTQLLFENNLALKHGGAIYLEEGAGQSVMVCQFQLLDVSLLPIPDLGIEFVFVNNSANEAGDALYGGMIDVCAHNTPSMIYNHSLYFENNNGTINKFSIFDVLGNFSQQKSNSVISSSPFDICFCLNGRRDCTVKILIMHKYPGETIQVELTGIGQRNGAVPTVINAVTNTDPAIRNDTGLRSIGRGCTSVTYSTHFTPGQDFENFILHPIKLYLFSSNLSFIAVIFKPCPVGFALDNKTFICACEIKLRERNMTECDIEKGTVTRLPPYWLSNYSDHFLIHDHCPYDYCISTPVQITMQEPNISKQCAFNRKGILCGQCKEGLSSVFGTSRCLPCSNKYLALTIAFAVVGIALVVFLFLLNLTVAIGTINGLIFYANIVKINEAIFFPPGDNSPLKIFISWVNLDLGIETCFYNGMDSYAKTWLQFVFPLYMWLILVMIIVGARHSFTLTRLFGSQAVPVLSTLFLLSFTKLLRVIATALSLTTLEYPDGSRVLWLYDGNVEVGKGKHIALLFIASVLLVTLIPYTLLLTAVQCLRKWSHKIFFLKWIETYFPIFEAYLRPYKHKYGYWTGLLLVVRVLLVLVFAFNIFGDPAVNLLAITLVVLAVILLNNCQGGVYKSNYLTVLEISFMVNLILLTAITSYNRQTGGNQRAAVYTSTSIAMGTFAMTLIYHTFVKLRTRCRRWKLSRKQDHTQVHLQRLLSSSQASIDNDIPTEEPTQSTVERVFENSTEDFDIETTHATDEQPAVL